MKQTKEAATCGLFPYFYSKQQVNMVKYLRAFRKCGGEYTYEPV